MNILALILESLSELRPHPRPNSTSMPIKPNVTARFNTAAVGVHL
jgi:hypothetical protein